ncbi:hypothetical protein QNH20_02630 [Neobacillus sp. WH10]|nr:hypothetical protein [Neobacillus sp. WH10]WHY78077.1 hypothetical protein QNH20_02630 [Neobacillus sp. WH10]
MAINSFIKKAAAMALSAGLIISPIHSVLSTEAIAAGAERTPLAFLS